MIRLSTESGWRLATHPDHAALAGDFAAAWGNELFTSPQPRKHVLEAIYHHDDGWRERDAAPQLTRQGLPSAFSRELVGTYSAFEEIDLADYLRVRGRALEKVAEHDPYAAVIVSMHTYDLLTTRADRSTIRPADLPLLDSFLADQLSRQQALRGALEAEGTFSEKELSDESWRDHFRLLQACDNLSLLACVDFDQPATLLHRLPTSKGEYREIRVRPRAHGIFELDPFPFGDEMSFRFPARLVEGKTFPSLPEFQQAFAAAPLTPTEIRVVPPSS